MDRIKIYKDKILYFKSFQEKASRNLRKIPGGIFMKLHERVQIETDVTLGDIFKMLIQEKELLETVFASSLNGVSFDLLISDFKQAALETEEIDIIEIFWLAELDESEFQLIPAVHGKIEAEANDESYALDYMPLHTLKNCKIVLNPALTVFSSDPTIDTPVLNTVKHFTMYEMVHALLYEFTFYGTPEVRNKAGKEIIKLRGKKRAS